MSTTTAPTAFTQSLKNQTASSAKELARIWSRFEAQYRAKLGSKPSKRLYALDLGFTPKALSTWMSNSDDLRRRVPLRAIPILRTALLMSDAEFDRLMLARVQELSEKEEVMQVANWVAQALCDRDQGQSQVLEVFARQMERFPRGLYFDAAEEQWISAFFEKLLTRAEKLYARTNEIEAILREDSGIEEAQFDSMLRQTTAQLQTLFKARESAKTENPWERSLFKVARQQAREQALLSTKRIPG